MLTQSLADAPGSPGIHPTWTSSAKDMVGCDLGQSRLWFTMGFGIINEVYYPRVDLPQIRDLGFIVADKKGFWVEVKRLRNYSIRLMAAGVPAVEVVHKHERFSLRLRVAQDNRRDVLAIECALEGDAELGLYVLLAPRLGASGNDNTAMVLNNRGRRLLCAEQGPFGVALAAVDNSQSDVFGRLSAGYVGVSDGWQDFNTNHAMTWEYPAAGPGNVALMGELPRSAVLALGFAASANSAATLAISSLMQPFENILRHQISQWKTWQSERAERSLVPIEVEPELFTEVMASAIVLKSHLDKTHPGAMVASLSVPWGDSGDQRGGYHLVWPRDLVQCAGGLLALGAEQEAQDTMRYLIATQNAEGRWEQNQWLGGEPYWRGIQLDETGFPVLLAAALEEQRALDGIDARNMVRRALSYIARTGPSTQQDRWEENQGINPFTLAVCIAALVAGGEFLEPAAREWAVRLADFWNGNVERWLSVRGTALAQRMNVGGYYVRVAPERILEDPRALDDLVLVKNHDGAEAIRAATEIGTEFLHLVRFGLRGGDDPLILDSVRVADAILRSDTPSGPVWHRYNDDGYGEHDDGRPFDGTGRGRGWPLLTGERGHYELVSGNDPTPYMRAMIAMASRLGMLPEQVWDQEPIEHPRLVSGRPSGSAMPLAWAHAEFIKLIVSRDIGHPFDRPRAVWERYQGQRPDYSHAFWWPHARIADFRAGARLVIALPHAAIVHWGTNGWNEAADVETIDSGMEFHAACLDADRVKPGERVDFTWKWQANGEWSGQDYSVTVQT